MLEDVLKQLSEKVLSALTSDAKPEARLAKMLDATNEFYNGGNDPCFISIFAIGANSDSLSQTLSSAVAGWLDALEATLHLLGLFYERNLESPSWQS